MPVIQDDSTAPKHSPRPSSVVLDLLNQATRTANQQQEYPSLIGSHYEQPLPPDLAPEVVQALLYPTQREEPPAVAAGLSHYGVPGVPGQGRDPHQPWVPYVPPEQLTEAFPGEPSGLGKMLVSVLSPHVPQLPNPASPEHPSLLATGPAESQHKFRDSLIHRDRNTQELSDQRFQDLTPLQRAAVNFNTMLAKAARQDTKMNQGDISLTSDQSKQYTDEYEKVFGSTDHENINKFYQPQTLALLNQLGYSNPNAAAGNFSTLSAAISQGDINRWLTKDESTGQLPDATGNSRGERVQELAIDTKELRQKLAEGNALLAGFTRSATLSRAPVVEKLGAKPAEVYGAEGANAPASTQENDFYTYYNVLLDPTTRDKALAQLPAVLADFGTRYGATADDFYTYAGRRAEDTAVTGEGGGDVMATLAKDLGLKKVAP